MALYDTVYGIMCSLRVDRLESSFFIIQKIMTQDQGHIQRNLEMENTKMEVTVEVRKL